MNSLHTNTTIPLLTLQEAAQKLGVSVTTLLSWNDFNILKPTITQSGSVGYTQAQIDQFLRIQQALLPTTSPHVSEPLPSPATAFQPVDAPIALGEMQKSLYETHKIPSGRIFSAVAVALVIVTLLALTQHQKLSSLLNQYERSYQSPTSSLQNQTSNFSVQLPVNASMQLTSGNSFAKNTHQGTDSVFAAKPSTTPTIKPEKLSSTNQRTVPTASVAAATTSLLKERQQLSQSATSPAPEADGTSIFANIAKQSTNKVANSPFDKSGNLTGNTSPSDLLAINTINPGLGSDIPTSQLDNNLRNQLIIVIFMALASTVYFIKRPKKVAVITPVASSKPTSLSEKVLEVDQKMDGTVVLTFQGKDYKVSKPELDSDSDQFISHLMKMAPFGVKEVEYDSFNDERFKISAPLSRLVTRLGFVGVKRDLFFPRTSKNRVLFRKYITSEDLDAMDITVEEIANNLSITS